MNQTYAAIARKRRRLQFIAAVFTGLAFFAAGAVYWANRATASLDNNVLSEQVTRGSIKETIMATGKIQPRAFVDVGAQASGRLNRIHVSVGDRVKVGELLAEIDPLVQTAKIDADRAQLAKLRADLVAQQAEADYAAAQLDRNVRLAPTSSISQSTVDLAVRDAKSSAARVDSILAQIEQMQSTLTSDQVLLGYTKIYAPMTGTVVSIDAREGQTLNAAYSTPVVLRIAELDTMTVWTQVSEADVTRLHVGMNVVFTTLGHGAREWQGRLKQILPAPQKSAEDTSTSTSTSTTNNVVLYTALFDVKNANGDLRPDMTAQVSFVTAEATNVIIAPLSALRILPNEANQAQVLVVHASGRAQPRNVLTGLRTRFEAEIVQGLSPDDRIVTGSRPAKNSRSLLGFQL